MTWSTNLLALPTLVRVSDVRFDCWFVAADKFILVLTGVVVQLLKLVATANRWLESLQEVPRPRELVQVFGGEISCWPDPVTCEQRRGPIQIDTKLALGQVRIELSTLSDLAGWFSCVCAQRSHIEQLYGKIFPLARTGLQPQQQIVQCFGLMSTNGWTFSVKMVILDNFLVKFDI